MAKPTFKLYDDEGPAQEFTVPRIKFIEIINHAIQEAHLAEAHPVVVEELQAMAATTNRADFGRWRVKDSCGCPLVKIGVVELVPNGPGVSLCGIGDRTIDNFVESYDYNMMLFCDGKDGELAGTAIIN